MIRFEGTLTPDAYRRALGVGGRPMQVVAWVLILAGVINFCFPNLALPVSWAMPVFLVLFGVMLLVMPRMTVKRAFATDRLLSEPITGEADEQGVRMKSTHGAVDLPWALHTVMVAPDLVAIHQSAGTIRIIPRQFFADEESWESSGGWLSKLCAIERGRRFTRRRGGAEKGGENMISLGLPELMAVLALVVWIALLVLVYRDASRRGMRAGFWMAIIFLLHLLGFIAYLIARGMKSSRMTSASSRETVPLTIPTKI